MHAGHIGLAPDNTAFKVAEGTSRLPEGLLLLSGASVRLVSKVTRVSRDGSFWDVHLERGRRIDGFDVVVVAAPVGRSNITFSGLPGMGSATRSAGEIIGQLQVMHAPGTHLDSSFMLLLPLSQQAAEGVTLVMEPVRSVQTSD